MREVTMFVAKSAAPHADQVSLHHPVLERAADEGITLLEAPAGYLFTDGLAAALADRKRPTVWLRPGPEDRDPAAFLISLMGSAQRLCPEVGAETVAQMRRHPGPISGWPGLFASLGRELAEALPTSCALVVEDIPQLNDAHPTLELFGTYVLSALPDSMTCTLTARTHVARDGLPGSTSRRTVSDLRLDVSTALTLAEDVQADLSSPCVRRAVALTEGRAVALSGLNDASAALGPKIIDQAVKRAHNTRELLSQVARAWLVTVDVEDLQALALAVRLGYRHPSLMKMAMGRETRSDGPWFQALADHWALLQPAWLAPLRAVLPPRSNPDPDTLLRMADSLCAQGALERAMPIYLDIGDTARASQAIVGSLDSLMGLGQWETLERWLSRLPPAALRATPWLVYVGAELAVAHGDDKRAGSSFASATALFHERRDLEGICQSMLAESALAAWHGKRAHAYARALAASALAEANGLTRLQGWAVWQLGCLAAANGDLDDALAHFARAEASPDAGDDSLMAGLLRLAQDLTLRQRELRNQRELHRNAYFAVERTEREVAERLRELLSSPPDDVLAMLEEDGWLRTPLMLKLPVAALPPPDAEPTSRSGVWGALIGAVGLRRRHAAPTVLSDPGVPQPSAGTTPDLLLPIGDGVETSVAGPPIMSPSIPDAADPVARDASGNAVPSRPDEKPTPARSAEGSASRPSFTAGEQASGPTLTAHLLGHLRVTLNELPVESWPSGRGKALFEYLLVDSDEPRPRDVLMELLWPEADPEAARNSLNVSMHGLRQALRTAADVPVVVYQRGAYRLSPALRVWIDVHEFEGHVHAARRLETAGDLAAAAGEFELAIGLYQGDFLADDPYEAWPVLIRERLRVAYLDTLDRLSQIYFGQGVYNPCGMLCQLILARDACREDAHCRLMRCYSRQHQYHLALRQYQVCVDALRAELDIDPTPATTQLYERIRRRELV
jgi:DNA-binding SARP family transcriptional activator/tetratricopeptide (TPR) repeat protein